MDTLKSSVDNNKCEYFPCPSCSKQKLCTTAIPYILLK